MLFEHSKMIKKEGAYYFRGEVTGKAHPALDKPIIKELWHGFSFHLSTLRIDKADQLEFRLGNAEVLPVGDASYAIHVTPDGIAVSAGNEKELICAFMTLIDLIRASSDGESVLIDCCEIREKPLIKNRMIHFCVFHSTELWQIERFIRFCGVLKYTHIVLEFWGMFKYRAMKELSWQEGYTAEQLRPLIQMANDLGIEIIPMLNHWGHASAGRLSCGKHVVLNQDPSLQYLFDQTGWCWDHQNPKTLELLGKMREELCDLCGKGGYFHIGCDEAYGFDYSEESMSSICSYVNDLAKSIKSLGRKTIIWGDMILSKHPEYHHDNSYVAGCKSIECEKFMQDALDKDIVVADWQYWVKNAPVETAILLKNAGFDTLLCPWDSAGDRLSVKACCETVQENDLFGIMHTTWHTLATHGMESALEAAMRCWHKGDASETTLKAAVALRKVYFSPSYERSGWKYDEVNT